MRACRQVVCSSLLSSRYRDHPNAGASTKKGLDELLALEFFEQVPLSRTELEALVACAHAALALYDMVKAVEREAVITDLRLDRKSGGRSGDYRRGR